MSDHKDVLRITYVPNEKAIITDFEIKYEDLKGLIKHLLYCFEKLKN